MILKEKNPDRSLADFFVNSENYRFSLKTILTTSLDCVEEWPSSRAHIISQLPCNFRTILFINAECSECEINRFAENSRLLINGGYPVCIIFSALTDATITEKMGSVMNCRLMIDKTDAFKISDKIIERKDSIVSFVSPEFARSP